MLRSILKLVLASVIAGAVNGLFGVGGGMILVPLLTRMTELKESEIFPASISIIFPMCLVSLGISAMQAPLPWMQAIPFLLGSAAGGILAGKWGKKIPTLWIHRILGLLILWGGFRYLWQ